MPGQTPPASAPAEVTALFDDLGDERFVLYPSLTRDELAALGDVPLVQDAEDLSWWHGLEEETRAQILATAQRGLLARGLVSFDPADPEVLEVAHRVRTVLALRQVPAFLALAGPLGRPGPALRCYGVLGPEGRSAVLVEARVATGVADYRLCAPAYAASALARYLLAAPEATDPDARPASEELGAAVVARRLELFPPGELADGRRLLVLAGDSEASLATVDAEGRAGTPSPADEQSLAALIGEHWRADAAEPGPPPE